MAGILASMFAPMLIDKIGGAIGLAKGGKVQKTGIYKLHKGELVVPTSVVKKKAPKAKTTTIKQAVRKAKGRKPARAKTAVTRTKKPKRRKCKC